MFGQLRRDRIARLEASGSHTYLDEAGDGLYAESPLAEQLELPEDGVCRPDLVRICRRTRC